MMAVLDRWFRLRFENMARRLQRQPYMDMVLSDVFRGVLLLVRHPWRQPSPQWCETVLARGECLLPNGRYCSSECMGGAGTMLAPCPPGYRPSLAWGFPVTGCWCDTIGGRNVICCDCTPAGNNPYQITADDCGCVHVYL